MTRFHREIFMNTEPELAWLKSTHLPAAPAFKSFTLAGSNDDPIRIDLYASTAPEYNDQPVAVFDQVEGVYVARPKQEKKGKQ